MYQIAEIIENRGPPSHIAEVSLTRLVLISRSLTKTPTRLEFLIQ